MVGLIEKDPGSINAFNMLKSSIVAKFITTVREQYQTKVSLLTKSLYKVQSAETQEQNLLTYLCFGI